MTIIPDRRPAEAGEIFLVKDLLLCRALLGTEEPGCCEVSPKSEGKQGQWICISCCVPFVTQFEKDLHCEKKAPRKSALVGSDTLPKAKHVLAWRSFESGKVEVP